MDRLSQSVVTVESFIYVMRRSLYVAHNVTSLLNQGSNAVGVLLGNGILFLEISSNIMKGWWGMKLNEPVTLLFQLSVNGRVALVSDGTWKGDASPITSDSVYNGKKIPCNFPDEEIGETYDARMEQEDWNEVGFDDSNWGAANEGSLMFSPN